MSNKLILKDVKNFEEKYKVSSCGEVINILKNKKLKLLERRNGYKAVCLCQNGKEYYKLVHRLVAEAFIENKNNLPQVNHIDFNTSNNNFKNLEWISSEDNVRHSKESGRRKSINNKKMNVITNPNRAKKLSLMDVINILFLRKNGKTQKEVSVIYNISFQTISDIENKKIWNGVEDTEEYKNKFGIKKGEIK